MGILAGISIYISDKDEVTGQPIQTEVQCCRLSDIRVRRAPILRIATQDFARKLANTGHPVSWVKSYWVT